MLAVVVTAPISALHATLIPAAQTASAITPHTVVRYAEHAVLHGAVLVVAALVLLVPGWLLLDLMGVTRVIPWAVRPSAAFVMTCTIVTPILLVGLVAGLPLPVRTGAFAVVTMALAWLARRRHRGSPRAALTSIYRRLRNTSRAERITCACVAAACAIGYVMGTTLSGDTFYHAGLANKLLYQHAPSLASMSRFVDGGPNPAYVLPVWHELAAVIAWLTPVDPLEVIWILPAATNALVVLASAGLARVLFRSEGAMACAAIAVMVARFAGVINHSLTYSSLPGFLVFDVVIPTFAALLVLAVHRELPTMRARILLAIAACACILEVLVLHANYILFPAVAMVGFVAVWAVQSPHSRVGVARAATVCGMVLATAVGALAVLQPYVSSLSYFGKGTDASTTVDALHRFAAAFVQVPGGGFHLAPQVLLANGASWLIGIVGCLVLTLWRREPVAWWCGGSVLALLAVTRSNDLFPRLIDLGNTAMYVRGFRAFPDVIGLTAMGMLAGLLAARAWSRVRPPNAAAAVTGVVSAAVIGSGWMLYDRVRQWGGVVQWVLDALIVLMVVYAVAAIIRTVRGRGRVAQPARPVTAPVLDVHGAALVLAAAFIALTAMPNWSAALNLLQLRARHRPIVALQTSLLRLYGGEIRHTLLRQPDDVVVMAPPEMGWDLPAIAPVYVAADHKFRLADTRANRTLERLALVREWYGTGGASDVDRFRTLREVGASLVIVDLRPNVDDVIPEFIARHPDRFALLARGQNVELYRLRHP